MDIGRTRTPSLAFRAVVRKAYPSAIAVALFLCTSILSSADHSQRRIYGCLIGRFNTVRLFICDYPKARFKS